MLAELVSNQFHCYQDAPSGCHTTLLEFQPGNSKCYDWIGRMIPSLSYKLCMNKRGTARNCHWHTILDGTARLVSLLLAFSITYSAVRACTKAELDTGLLVSQSASLCNFINAVMYTVSPPIKYTWYKTANQLQFLTRLSQFFTLFYFNLTVWRVQQKLNINICVTNMF